MTKVTIAGAGMAGLLAGNMLSRLEPTIIEKQSSLPNNHSAVLRFRSGAIGDIIGVPFKKVSMIKGYQPWKNPIADSLAYSRKCSGISRSDRSIVSTGMDTHERFIAPPDLISRMAEGVPVVFFNKNISDRFVERTDPVISTMPMGSLMEMLKYPYRDISFNGVHGFNITATVEGLDAYCSLYVPQPDAMFNRISVTGNLVTVEYSFPGRTKEAIQNLFVDNLLTIKSEFSSAMRMLGMTNYVGSDPVGKLQAYSKITPINEEIRKDFLHWATDRHNVYSLGRFATWRPGLLLDDLVKDIRLIEGWIKSSNGYAVKSHRRET